MTTTATTATTATSINILDKALGHGFEVRTIIGASDEHGVPCEWCDDNDPCVTNIYFTECHGGVFYDETAHTCVSADCVLAATDERSTLHGGDVVVEVSTAVIVSRPALASW